MYHQWGWDRLCAINGRWDRLCTINGGGIDCVSSMGLGKTGYH